MKWKMQPRFKSPRITPLLLSSFLLFLVISCIKNEYDLSTGIISEVTVGGDSLLIQIGSTKPIRLDSMIKAKDIELLKKSEDGSYSLGKGDSVISDVKSINPVTFSINPITINPSTVSFADLTFPTFVIDPVSSTTTFVTPSFIVNQQVQAIDVTNDISQVISVSPPSPVRSNIASKGKASTQFAVGPIGLNISKSFTQVLNIASYPAEIVKVDKVLLKSNTVTIRFDKSKINSLAISNRVETVKSFRIDFPTEYGISNAVGPTGSHAKIVGNSFIVENDVLDPTQDIVYYSFNLDYLNVENVPQPGSMSMSRNIPYTLQYDITGDVNNLTDINGKTLDLTLTIKASPVMDNIELESNETSITMDAGSKAINKEIGGIPSEVTHLNQVTFEPNAYINLTISNPNIDPFSLSSGYIEVVLPKTFIFKPTAGLNTSSNVYTLPYDNLYGTKRLDVTGMNINKDIADGVGAFTVNESLSYKAVGLKLASIRTFLKTAQGMGNKDLTFSGTFNNFKISDASVTTKKITAAVPSKTSDFNISKFVSNDLKKLYLVDLKTPSQLQLKLNVKGLPQAFDSLFFYNYTISFPKCLKFAAGNVNSQNQIILNRGFKVTDGFVKIVTLEGIDFGVDGLSLTNGTFNLNESVSLEGSVYVKGANLNVKDMGTITVEPSMSIGDMTVSNVEGQFAPVIDPILKTVNLNLPNFLKQEGTKLDIINPVITIEVANTTGIPIDIAMDLIPKRSGNVISAGKISTSMSILAAETLGQPTWSKFLISPSSKNSSVGYQSIVIPNLPDLLKTVPDELEIKVTPTVTGTRHKVDLQSAVNQLKVKYNIHVPLDFGQEFQLQYTDTVADLHTKLKDFTNYADTVAVIAAVDNEIPLDLNLELVPLDKDKKVVTGIKINQSNTIKSCNIDGSAQRTNINLGLKELVSGAIDQLDAISFKVNASKNSTVAGMPLKASQSVKIALKVRVLKGVTVK
ncbi:MAG: hypothetical protein ACOYOT_08430 [Bacteroidales bacterium]